MANPNFKGRQKGSTKKTSLIEDPTLGDYKVIFDEESYNLIYTDPTTKSEKIVGYFSSLSSALSKIARNRIVESQPTYTIKEYIKELNSFNTNLDKLINS
jgi:uncharacterized protein YutD